MPIAAIKETKLFCGHWVSHCFLQVCFIYKTFFEKSQERGIGIEPTTSNLEG
jgi:hypothetical protein